MTVGHKAWRLAEHAFYFFAKTGGHGRENTHNRSVCVTKESRSGITGGKQQEPIRLRGVSVITSAPLPLAVSKTPSPVSE